MPVAEINLNFQSKYLDAVVTDPPYYDAIAYADLSDFFYVWLKRSIGDMYPLNFCNPSNTKNRRVHCFESIIIMKVLTEAKEHFEDKLTQIFDALETQTIRNR